jgi:hypothetical protein
MEMALKWSLFHLKELCRPVCILTTGLNLFILLCGWLYLRESFASQLKMEEAKKLECKYRNEIFLYPL